MRVLAFVVLAVSAVCSRAQIQASFTMDVKKGCPPLTVNFTNTTPGGSSNSYQWDFGDGGISTAVSPSHTYTTAGDFIVTLNGFDGSFFPLITGMDSVSVTGVSLTAVPNICIVTVDSSSTKNIVVWEKPSDPGVAAVNIYRTADSVWVFAGSVVKDSLSRFIDTGVFPNDSSYSYRITFADSCGTESAVSTIHTTMHLVSYTTPPGNELNLTWVSYSGFNISGARILRDTTGFDSFTVIDSVQPGMVSYVDSFPPANAVYVVEVLHPVGCSATKMVENHNSSRSNKTFAAPPGSVDAASGPESYLNLFPNPNAGKFRVFVNEAGFKEGKICIYDMFGQIVYRALFSGNDPSFFIDLGNMRRGVYFIQVSGNGRAAGKKIIVQ
jgi:hypothetical protein